MAKHRMDLSNAVGIFPNSPALLRGVRAILISASNRCGGSRRRCHRPRRRRCGQSPPLDGTLPLRYARSRTFQRRERLGGLFSFYYREAA